MYHVKKNWKTGVDKETIRSICIDDFAIKKRQRYGSIMIDTDTGKIVDMIPSRETEDVGKWLSSFPHIQVVSRDGSTAYSAAVKQAHPTAVQVSDRFHLIKGVNDRARDVVHRLFKGRVVIPLTEKTAHREILLGSTNKALKARIIQKMRTEGRNFNEIYALTGITPRTARGYLKMSREALTYRKQDTREKEHLEAVNRLVEKVSVVRKLHLEGYTIQGIHQKTGINPQTVRKYLSPSFIPVNGQYGKHREGKLARYREEVLRLKSEGTSYADIFSEIQSKGYKGGPVALRGLVARERRIRDDVHRQYGNTSFELLDKKWLLQLLYQPLEKVTGLTKEQYKAVITTYPMAAKIYEIVKKFKDIILDNKPRRLLYWIKKVSEMNIPEMDRFINGLRQDYDAVKNSILYTCNNGLAEGKVNKVKVIKRIMYGRCSFDLLREKTLKIEHIP